MLGRTGERRRREGSLYERILKKKRRGGEKIPLREKDSSSPSLGNHITTYNFVYHTPKSHFPIKIFIDLN